jgi:hypothetical protein
MAEQERATEGGGPEARLEAIDHVDGRFVLRARASDSRAAGGWRELAADSFEVELTAGDADVERDPYTGRYLLTPKAGGAVRGRAVGEADGATIATEDVPLGIDSSTIPRDELRFVVAGGGACAARWQMAGQIDFNVNVRASVASNVVPLTENRRELFWRNGLYWAHDPAIGLMRLDYNPERTSKIVLESGSAGDFFPGDAENNLYFVIDFVDLGYRAFNKEPMRQRVSDMRWPPFADEVLAIEKPLDFYDVDDPDTLVMTLVSQDMRLYDYSSIDVEQLDSTLGADGRLDTRWRITNQSDERTRLRWFALGSFDRLQDEPVEGSRLLGPAGSGVESFEVSVSVGAQRSLLRQTLSLAAVSLTDSIFAGQSQIDYRFTDDERTIL